MNTPDKKKDFLKKTILYNGYEIHYSISGMGQRELIVCVHPAFSDQNAFLLQRNAFTQKFTLITVDLIGHGLSKVRNTSDKLEVSPHHMAAILKQEGFEKAHIVGVSMGALIAQYFAYLYPDKVLSLTGLGGYAIHVENKELAKAQMGVNIVLILRALISLKSFRKEASKMTCYTLSGQQLFKESMALFERKSFKYMTGLQHVVKNRPDVKPTYPTLVLTGEHDIPLAHKMAKLWFEDLPNSQYSEIKGGGHCAQLDQPLSFNEQVLKFISGVKY